MDLQPFYDILLDAFRAGQAHALNDNGPTAGDVLFPLAARMETAIQKVCTNELEVCIRIADNFAIMGNSTGLDIVRRIRAIPAFSSRPAIRPVVIENGEMRVE